MFELEKLDVAEGYAYETSEKFEPVPIDDNSYKIIGYTGGDIEHLVIPNEIDGKKIV